MILHYDLETTGFVNRKFPLDHASQPRIVQIGAILDDDEGKEVMRLDLILNCGVPIPDAAANVHGITTERSERLGVNEGTAIDLFLDLVDVADVIVGQNITGFDNDVMTGTVRRIYSKPDAMPFEGKAIFDTMLVGQAVCKIPGKTGGFKKPNLTEMHMKLFGVGFEGAHTAISDVLAARACFYRLQEIVKEKRP